MSAATRVRAWLARRFPRWTAIVALALMVATIGFSVPDISSTRGRPREHVTLVSAVKRKPPFTVYCGRGGGLPTDYVWRSANPPAGLPETFQILNTCEPRYDVGDHATAVRIPTRNGHARAYLDPVLSYGDAFWMGIGLAILWYLLYFVGKGLRSVWHRYFWYDEPRGPEQV